MSKISYQDKTKIVWDHFFAILTKIENKSLFILLIALLDLVEGTSGKCLPVVRGDYYLQNCESCLLFYRVNTRKPISSI